MAKPVSLSVVVCAHNEERHVQEQLDALLAQQWEGTWDVVVVDNGSTDTTAKLVLETAQVNPRVRLVSATERPGQSYGMNVGVESTDSRWLAFCDADDVVAPGWLAALADGLTRYDVVTGPHELDRLNPSWLAESRGRSIEEPRGSFYGIFPCIRGAGWATKRSVWDRVGGMDESYSAGQDVEFSLRCWLAGVDVVGVPSAVVHYRYRDTPRGLWRQGLAYGRFRPRIARLLEERGKARPPRLAGWRSWALLVLRLPSLANHEGRSVWAWMAGNRVGQVLGSIRERTLIL